MSLKISSLFEKTWPVHIPLTVIDVTLQAKHLRRSVVGTSPVGHFWHEPFFVNSFELHEKQRKRFANGISPGLRQSWHLPFETIWCNEQGTHPSWLWLGTWPFGSVKIVKYF